MASLVHVGEVNGPARPAKHLLPVGLLAVAAVLSSLTACKRLPHASSATTLTTAEQVRQLAPDEAASQVPVHLRGTVTFAEGGLWLLFIQDSTGAVRVEGAPINGLNLGNGRLVELTGVTASGGSDPVVTSRRIVTADGYSSPPDPMLPNARSLVSGELQYRYVEIEGVVRSATMDRGGRIALGVHSLGWDVQTRVIGLYPWEYRSLVDAVVRARGVLVTSFDARGLPASVKLWVAAVKDVVVAKPAPNPEGVPVTAVRSVLSAGPTRLPEHRVRLRGAVSLDGRRMILRDSTGALPLRPARSESIEAGRVSDIVGFVSQEQGSRLMTECAVLAPATQQRSIAPLPLLTTVSQVKGLTEDRVRRRYPVHLRAVITYRSPLAGNTFAQDQTGGVYLFVRPGTEPEVRLGDLVEVDGFSGPGGFAPLVAVKSVRVIGRQALPAPLRKDMEQLFTGIADSTWVEAEGVVHSVRREGEMVVLGVNWGLHHFSAYVFGSAKLPDSLLDSHVHLQGVCGSLFNFKRQVLGMQMYVPDARFVHADGGGAPPSPPLRDVEQLLQFSPSSNFGERSRIRGVVTLSQRTGPTYVSDSTGGVLIQDHQPVDLQVGDSVEVLGFAVAIPGLFNPVLRDAEVHKLGYAGPPEPRLLTATGVLDEGYDAGLVQVDAVLVDQAAAQGNQSLVLQAGDRVFNARIDQRWLPPFEKGSLLRVTGITSMRTSESRQAVLPTSFSLLLRSADDVVVLRPAPWWTAARTLRLLGFACALALLSAVWILALRRRVRQQTADLRASRQMLQLVLDNIPQRVFWKDRESRYLGCNKAFAADAGVPTPQDIVGKTVYDVFHRREPADMHSAYDRQVLETGQATSGYEETMVFADGTEHCARVTKVPLPGSLGGVMGVLGTYEDITESKRAEEKLRSYSAEVAEANEELKRFTYIVSHDLRAPLVSLKGFATELRYSLDTLRKPEKVLLASLEEPDRTAVAQALQEEVPEALAFVESSVTRMDHLIGALLRLSRVGYREFHMEDLDPGAVLQETLRTLAHQIENRNIAVDTSPLPHIASDRTAVEQIFGNLLDNSVKYLDPHRPGHIQVSAEETADAVFFRVRDNGRGIAEEDMDKVFAPFRRAGPHDVPGEGMGLAYVRALLHRLGGRIDCKSELGVGTTFTFRLPKVK